MSESEIKELWEEYYPKVYGYFLRRVDSKMDIEDLTSLSLERFLASMLDDDKRAKITNPRAYLWKICHNQLVNFINFKSKTPMHISLDDNLDSIDIEIEESRSQSIKDRFQDLIACIKSQLDEKQMKIFNLSIIEDMKSPAVAEMLGLSSDNVRQILSRAVQKVRNQCGTIWNTLKS